MTNTIAIKCNGGYLDLMPDSSIEWEWQSQLFEMDMGGNAEYSLPLDIPFTNNNLRLLNFENLLGLSDLNEMPYDAELYVDGYCLIKCKLYITNLDGNITRNSGKFSIAMVGFKSDFLKKSTDLNLRKMSLGNPLTSDAIANKVYPTIVVRDDNCGEGNYELPEWMANVYINGAMQTVGLGFNDKKFIKIPFFKMIFILKKIFSAIGINLTSDTSNVLTDTEFDKIILEANLCENDGYETNSTPPYYGLTWQYLSTSLAMHMPDVTVADFVAALKVNFGMHFNYKSDGSVDIILMKDIAAKTAIDWSGKANPNYTKHIPQTRIGTFIFQFTEDGTDGYVSKPMNEFGNVVNYVYNSMTVDYPIAEVEDVSQISLPSSYPFFYVKNQNSFYKNTGVVAKAYGNALQKLILGNKRDSWLSGDSTPANSLGVDGDYYLDRRNDTLWLKANGIWGILNTVEQNGKFNAKSPASIPAMIKRTIPDIWNTSAYTFNYFTPIQDREYKRVEMVGDSHPMVTDPLNGIVGEPGLKLRFLLWHGIQNPYNYTTPYDLSYGYASTSNYLVNNIGTKLSDFNLSWYGSEGLFATFWKPFEKTLTDYTEVVFKIKFSILDLINLDITCPVQINNNQYYIKSIKQSFPMNKEAIVTLILKK